MADIWWKLVLVLILKQYTVVAISILMPPTNIQIAENVVAENPNVYTPPTTGAIGTVLYSVTITPPDGKFRSHYENGSLYYLGNPNFDYETTRFYTVVVKAVDTTSTASGTYPVYITNVNELPIITNLPASVGYTEAPWTKGSVGLGNLTIFRLEGWDAEDGTASAATNIRILQYQLTSVTPVSGVGKFRLKANPDSNEVFINPSPLFDYETVPQYNLSIQSIDSTGALGPAAILTVDIIDINEAPFFNTSVGLKGTCDYDENLPVGTVLDVVVPVTGEIRAYDYDRNDVLTYELDGLDQEFFGARNENGAAKLYIAQVPDYEARIPAHTIAMNVRARDKAGLITSTPFVVTMNMHNVNDNLPVCSPTNYTGSVSEGAKTGDKVLTISCTDLDGPLDSYEITDHTDPFKLFFGNATTGDLLVKTPPDYELETVLSFPVWAVQGLPNPQTSSSVSVTVTIAGVNDNRPRFDKLFYNFDVRYDAPLATSVGRITATDHDITTSTLTYDWVSEILQFRLDPVDGRVRVQDTMADNAKWVYFAVARDNDNPPDYSDYVPMRIDTFSPSAYLVDFVVSEPISYFTDTRLAEFLAAISSACSPCLARFSNMAPTPGQESEATTLSVYALTDNTTESFANIESNKLYVPKAAMLSVFSLDSVGTPSSATTTTGFHSFPVTKVTGTIQTLTPGEWLTQTGGGIAILTLLGLGAAAAVAGGAVAIGKSGILNRQPVSHDVKQPSSDVDTFDYRYKDNNNQRFSSSNLTKRY